jgi:hypothetical protein
MLSGKKEELNHYGGEYNMDVGTALVLINSITLIVLTVGVVKHWK